MSFREDGVEVGGDPKTRHWGELVDTRVLGWGYCRDRTVSNASED